MNPGLVAYHELLDSLVARRPDVVAEWVREARPWPASSGMAKFNAMVASFSPLQRQLVAELLQQARDSGMHDVLVELSERANLRGLRLVQDGIELPAEPHGTEMFFDWTARCAGEAWPHEG